MSDFARKLIGVESLNAAGGHLDGRGQLIAVIDSGIDREHPDFDGRVAYAQPGVAGGTVDDLFGHGTHVAGTAAGSGAMSNGKLRGIAPGSKLVIIGIVDEGGRLQLPVDLGSLLDQAAAQGAKIVNLSWETPLASVYDSGSRAVDNFMRRHPDVLVVVAAGNDGEAPEGYPYLYSVGAPATAKNALTVGACDSSRPDITDTWASYDAARFPVAPTSEHRIAGDPELIAAFSSRGPTDFESIKPDVVAPGTAILAPRAKKANPRRFWRECPEHRGYYAYMNGTSMAAPVVSGAAAIVRQYLYEQHHIGPSAALVKAVLIAGAHPLPWGRENEQIGAFGYPDFDQGFGRIDLTAALPGPTAPADRKLWIEDVSCDDAHAVESRAPVGSQHKATQRYRFTATKSQTPLRVVMTWTDYGERDVQNSLSLELQGPGGLIVRGNADHLWQKVAKGQVDPRYFAAAVDRRNNVQGVSVEPVEGGNYTLTVFASNTLFPPQGYSLCITGSLVADPVAS